jgi:hypothetical protein
MIFAARVVLAAALLSIFAVATVHDDYCRCEAEFERFYDRRHLGETVSSYVNEDGYFVVDGIIVLPSDSDECRTHDDDDYYYGGKGKGKVRFMSDAVFSFERAPSSIIILSYPLSCLLHRVPTYRAKEKVGDASCIFFSPCLVLESPVHR